MAAEEGQDGGQSTAGSGSTRRGAQSGASTTSSSSSSSRRALNQVGGSKEQQTTSRSSSQRSSKDNFTIFEENEESLVGNKKKLNQVGEAAENVQWKSLGAEKDRTKENRGIKTKWNEAPLQNESAQSHSTRSSVPKMDIFVDPEFESGQTEEGVKPHVQVGHEHEGKKLSIRQKLDSGSRSEQIMKNPLALHSKKVEELQQTAKECTTIKASDSKTVPASSASSGSSGGFTIFSDETASASKPKKREEKPASSASSGSSGGFTIFSDETTSVSKPKKREEKPASSASSGSSGGFTIFSDETASATKATQQSQKTDKCGEITHKPNLSMVEEAADDDIDFNFLDSSGGENETINTKLAKIDIDLMFAPTPEKPTMKVNTKSKVTQSHPPKQKFAIFNPTEQQVVSPFGNASSNKKTLGSSSISHDNDGISQGEIKNNNSMVFIDDSMLQFDATTEMPLPMPPGTHGHSDQVDMDQSSDVDLFRFSSASKHGKVDSGRKGQTRNTVGSKASALNEGDVIGANEDRVEEGQERRCQGRQVNSFYMSSSDDISESALQNVDCSRREHQDNKQDQVEFETSF
eukprot:CAMPEP_0114431038 /NCGR_PEP_ID=MMETSP0103-20121206/10377_1 /TAXON_ID=37642 ORGANISM="Paraphysomonas imperforata, Strain PA2" /NCGR_SAMPLE_ID=MMETSP0103 /ASSEMBLY_ACC=CAM_ASM_000201 /LENGTH=577 /DNA_ID=CAMNT_0001600557 /DNA_START=201 /DNA_END=1934 /DNA_ORIENTATION=+